MLSLTWQEFWAQSCPSPYSLPLFSHPSLSQFPLGIFSYLLLVWFGISLVKCVDLCSVNLCSQSWFFMNREIFPKVRTHTWSLAIGVLEGMGRGYPFQIFTDVLLLKVNIVWCNNNNINNDNNNRGKTQEGENCQAMQGEPVMNLSKNPWV